MSRDAGDESHDDNRDAYDDGEDYIAAALTGEPDGASSAGHLHDTRHFHEADKGEDHHGHPVDDHEHEEEPQKFIL